jgi:uncharacterized protein (DUF1501 family)
MIDPHRTGLAAVRCPGPRQHGTHRRELLRFAAHGMLGLGWLDLVRARAAAAAPSAGKAGSALEPRGSDTAVILVWCHGGPSHLETYDPKPDAPSEYRGPFGAISTSLAGVRFSELVPMQARIAHRCALIRSVHHRGPCHDSGMQTLLNGHEVLVNKFAQPDHPDAFCIANQLRSRPGDALPVYVGAPPLAYSGPAYLGPSAAPFVVSGDPNAPNFEVPNIRLAGDGARERLDRRMRLLTDVGEVRRDLERLPDAIARDQQYQAAVDLLTSGRAREAFDLSRESSPTRERYGRNRWGQQLLLARRLVEAGVGVVSTSLNSVEGSIAGSWDDHAVNWDCFKAMKERAPVFDRAVTALIEDLYDRGLDRRVLVIVTGEFGRTPKINYVDGKAGRDHWPQAMSILLAGGGLRMGQVIGGTDPRGEAPSERALHPNDFLATLYHHLGIDTRIELRDRSGRPIPILDRTDPIPELL